SVAIGSPREPITIDVADQTVLETFLPSPGRSSVHLSTEYLDFATFDARAGDRTDHLFAANVDFTYRLDSHVESLGVGYGTYVGSGGFADRVWTPDSPIVTSAFNYGYADIEVGTWTDGIHLSAGSQVIAGVGKDGFGLGIEGRVRIGDRDATNLAIVGRHVDQVGFLSDIRFGVSPIDHFRLGLSVGATDQPHEGEVSVKLGTDLEVRVTDELSILLRGSWQGRTTAHGGIGGGAGLGVFW
ncbi:MAG: hypothetical protein NT062_12115, partial [Proteobacteria bacterium]|nr:hypothetical protein [Pseudomonadota bacterium]